ncbi:MAG: DUF370 domain-containing protein [Peptococcaceae bacterium]|nr:DUF370 domain-containing protein [Peptococcaceae bacterium]
MFLHLGNNFMLRKDKIIAIIDVETGANNNTFQNYLSNIESNKIMNIAEDGKQKSIIVSDQGIYLSPISSSTLSKRSMIGIGLES